MRENRIASFRDQRFADHTLRTADVGNIGNNRSIVLKKAKENEVENTSRGLDIDKKVTVFPF